jgi:hypothetical protein
MRLPPTVFETVASTIPPLRHGRTLQVYPRAHLQAQGGLARPSDIELWPWLGHLRKELTEARNRLVDTESLLYSPYPRRHRVNHRNIEVLLQ